MINDAWPADGGDGGLGKEVDPLTSTAANLKSLKYVGDKAGNSAKLTFKKSSSGSPPKKLRLEFKSAASTNNKGIYQYFLHLSANPAGNFKFTPFPITMYDLAKVSILDGHGCVEEGSNNTTDKYGRPAKVSFTLQEEPKLAAGEELIIKGYLRFMSSWCETATQCSRGDPRDTTGYRAYFSKLDGTPINPPPDDPATKIGKESILEMKFTKDNWSETRKIQISGVYNGGEHFPAGASEIKVFFRADKEPYKDRLNKIRLDDDEYNGCKTSSKRSDITHYQ